MLVACVQQKRPRLQAREGFLGVIYDEEKLLGASWFAAALIGALFFSILFIFLLILRISKSV